MKPIGTITVSVFKYQNDVDGTTSTAFYINVDNEDVLPISDIIEDTLKLY